jgi:hypothetical protein
MADTPDVKVRFTAEDTGVAAAIKQLVSSLQELKQKQQETAESAFSLRDAYRTIIELAVVEKIREFGKAAFDSAVNIERMSQKTGLSAQTLSVYGKAAEDVGVSQDSVDKSLTKLQQNIVKFQAGGAQGAAAFKALGLAQKDFVGLNSDQKLTLVTDALGKMANGSNKAYIAQQLMGRGGAELIPVMNQLAGDGFEKVSEEAEKLGVLLDQDTVTAAVAAKAAMVDLEEAGKGIATQFEAGLMPAIADIADSFTNDIAGTGVSSFRTLGEYAGTVIKTIVFAFDIGIDTIGALFLGLVDIVHGVIQQVANAELTIYQAAADAAKGNLKQAGQDLADGFHFAKNQMSSDIDDIKSRFTSLASLTAQQSANLFPSDDVEKQRMKDRAAKVAPQGGDGEGNIQDNAAAKARLAALKAGLDQELAMYRAYEAQRLADDKFQYDTGLIGFEDYFARRRAELQAETDKEIEILEKQRALLVSAPTNGTDADAIKRRQEIAAMDAKIAEARVQASTKQKALDQDEYKAREDNQKKVLSYQQELLKAQGDTFDATMLQIQSEAEQIRRSLVQAGLSPDQVASMMQQLEAAKTLAAQFDEDRKQSSLAIGQLDIDKKQIELDVQNGLIAQVNQEKALAQLEAQRLPTLQALADAQLKAAQATGDPQKIQEAEKFAEEVQQVGIQADYARQQWTKFDNEVASAFQSDLANFLAKDIDQVHGIGDAFRSLASTALQSLRNIAAQMIATMAIQKLMSALGFGKDDGAKQVANAAAAGVAQATPLIAASAAMTAGGASVTAGAAALGVSASALMAAAIELEVANASGGGGGGGLFAEGGLVKGPGSATSDSIPARLSDGEYVVNADAVKKIGLPALEAINRGLRTPAIQAMPVQRFADGGLVRSGGSSTMDLHLGIGLDHGLILKALTSKAAGKIFLQHLTDNPKAAAKAISRAQ